MEGGGGGRHGSLPRGECALGAHPRLLWSRKCARRFAHELFYVSRQHRGTGMVSLASRLRKQRSESRATGPESHKLGMGGVRFSAGLSCRTFWYRNVPSCTLPRHAIPWHVILHQTTLYTYTFNHCAVGFYNWNASFSVSTEWGHGVAQLFDHASLLGLLRGVFG